MKSLWRAVSIAGLLRRLVLPIDIAPGTLVFTGVMAEERNKMT